MKIIRILYQPYKWFFFVPFLFINTLVFGVLAVILSNLINQKTGSYVGGALWSRVNACFTPMLVQVTGLENIKKGTSYVVTPNHQSYYDIFALYGWLPLDLKFVMKKELEKVPGLGFGSKSVGHIFLDRRNAISAAKTIAAARDKLVNGTSVIMFPEGTRSSSGIPGRFKKGAFVLATDLRLPILPVTILGTQNILPNNSLNLLPGRVKIIIHPAIEASGDNRNIDQLMSATRQAIVSALPGE